LSLKSMHQLLSKRFHFLSHHLPTELTLLAVQNGGDPTQNVALSQCPDGSWCCGGSFNSTCCNDKLGVKIDAIVGVSNTTSSSSTSSISSTSTSSILSTSTSPGSANSATTTPSNSPVAQTGHSSLSGGAKAGIGIGVGLAAVLIVAAVVAYFTCWKRRSKGAVGGPVDGGPSELPGAYQERTAYQEMGSHKPEPFQHEVEGYIPVPMAELAESRYR
jgi:hypothetical protein